MDIQVKEFTPPVIAINYEDLEAELKLQLKYYSGLVVTEETLAGSKSAQKELASLRVKIDTYRKEKKRELETPIKEFEEKCKKLISLIETVEKPIKDGIQYFDDQKREEKRQIALQLAAKVAEAAGLNVKYAAKLDVLEKYMNLTATVKGVTEDLETRAFALKVEQDREEERLEIIHSVLKSENSRLRTPLTLDFVKYELEKEVPTSVIIEKIKAQAALIYEAENKPVEPPKEAEPTPEPPKEEKPVNEPQAQPEKQYTATIKMVGSLEELRSVSAYLKANKVTYEVLEQKEV